MQADLLITQTYAGEWDWEEFVTLGDQTARKGGISDRDVLVSFLHGSPVKPVVRKPSLLFPHHSTVCGLTWDVLIPFGCFSLIPGNHSCLNWGHHFYFSHSITKLNCWVLVSSVDNLYCNLEIAAFEMRTAHTFTHKKNPVVTNIVLWMNTFSWGINSFDGLPPSSQSLTFSLSLVTLPSTSRGTGSMRESIFSCLLLLEVSMAFLKNPLISWKSIPCSSWVRSACSSGLSSSQNCKRWDCPASANFEASPLVFGSMMNRAFGDLLPWNIQETVWVMAGWLFCLREKHFYHPSFCL